MRTLRQYRLFVTLLVLPILAIVMIVVLVIALSGGGGQEESGTAGVATPAAVSGLPAATGAASPAAITVAPTQTPLPEPTPTEPLPEPTPTEPPIPTPTPLPEGPIDYEVQDGDTLFTIASQFGVSVEDLVEFNNLPDENYISVGQVLEVPTDPSQLAERRQARPTPVTAVVAADLGLNVRSAPDTASGTVQYVAPSGSGLDLTGVQQEIDGVTWWEVADGNWVQGQYLDFSGQAAPAPPPAATETPAATEATAAPATPAAGQPVTASVVPAAGLNVRVAADPTAAVAYVAPGESTLQLSGETQLLDGVTWWRVSDGNWVQGQFLRFG